VIRFLSAQPSLIYIHRVFCCGFVLIKDVIAIVSFLVVDPYGGPQRFHFSLPHEVLFQLLSSTDLILLELAPSTPSLLGEFSGLFT
jgi:hypothetical protein